MIEEYLYCYYKQVLAIYGLNYIYTYFAKAYTKPDFIVIGSVLLISLLISSILLAYKKWVVQNIKSATLLSIAFIVLEVILLSFCPILYGKIIFSYLLFILFIYTRQAENYHKIIESMKKSLS